LDFSKRIKSKFAGEKKSDRCFASAGTAIRFFQAICEEEVAKFSEAKQNDFMNAHRFERAGPVLPYF
jgi:hypothetical protein